MKKQLVVWLAKRLLLFVCSLAILSVIVFYLSRLAPGDPLVSYYGDRVEKMSVEEREWAEQKLGLNDPVHVQYGRWLENALSGNFGISYKYKMDVLEVIEGRIGNTLILGGSGYVLIFVLALVLGAACAKNEGSILDRLISRAGTVVSCIPEFWLSLIFILLFSVTLRWLPSGGAYSVGHQNEFGDRIRHLILPLSVLVISHLWYYAYMIRNKLAKIKGLGKRHILIRHCLQNVFPSYLSMMALALPHIMGGTYIVEMVFSYPGLGTLSFESARYKDYHLLMLLCLLTGAVVILSHLLVQMLNEWIDPRMRPSKDESGGGDRG